MRPITLLLAILCFISACRKQAGQATETPALKLPQETAAAWQHDLSPGNTENPFDSYGLIHNRLLADAQQHILETGDTGLLSVQYHIVRILQKQRPFDPQVLKAVSPAFQHQVLLKAGNMPELSGLSVPMQRYGRQLFTLLTNNSDLNYGRIKDGIVTIEKAVIADPALKDSERQALLQTAAIARYSVYHWITWAGSAEGQKVLYRGNSNPHSLAIAVMVMYNADCLAMWHCYVSGLFQDPKVTAEDILALVSGVSAVAFIMVMHSM